MKFHTSRHRFIHKPHDVLFLTFHANDIEPIWNPSKFDSLQYDFIFYNIHPPFLSEVWSLFRDIMTSQSTSIIWSVCYDSHLHQFRIFPQFLPRKAIQWTPSLWTNPYWEELFSISPHFPNIVIPYQHCLWSRPLPRRFKHALSDQVECWRTWYSLEQYDDILASTTWRTNISFPTVYAQMQWMECAWIWFLALRKQHPMEYEKEAFVLLHDMIEIDPSNPFVTRLKYQLSKNSHVLKCHFLNENMYSMSSSIAYYSDMSELQSFQPLYWDHPYSLYQYYYEFALHGYYHDMFHSQALETFWFLYQECEQMAFQLGQEDSPIRFGKCLHSLVGPQILCIENLLQNQSFFMTCLSQGVQVWNSHHLRTIPLSFPKIPTDTYQWLNPSILKRADESFWMLMRASNYHIETYESKDLDGKIRTENYIVQFNPISYEFISPFYKICPLYESDSESYVHGLEDMRLFEFQNEIYFTANCCDLFLFPNRPQVVIGKLDALDPCQNTVKTSFLYPFPKGKWIEKNWMPMVLNESLYMIYSFHPAIVIYRVHFLDTMGIHLEQIYHEKHIVPRIPSSLVSDFRGSSTFLPMTFFNRHGHLGFIHQVYFSKNGRQYFHRAIFFDEQQLTISPPFLLSDKTVPIEYLVGWCPLDDQNVLLSYGKMDQSMHILQVPIQTIETELFTKGRTFSIPTIDFTSKNSPLFQVSSLIEMEWKQYFPHQCIPSILSSDTHTYRWNFHDTQIFFNRRGRLRMHGLHSPLYSERLAELPPIFFINRQHSIDRKQQFESQFGKYANITRIEAVDADNPVVSPPFHLYTRRPCKNAALHQNDKTTALVFSHIRALETFVLRFIPRHKYPLWIKNTSISHHDERMAIIMEDDATVEYIDHWPCSWSEFVQSLPFGWECIQLSPLLPCKSSLKEWRPQYPSQWVVPNQLGSSTLAYLIRWKGAHRILRWFYLESNYQVTISDIDIYAVFPKQKIYMSCFPLFIFPDSNSSEIHPKHVKYQMTCKQQMKRLFCYL